ncbi:hypothetical protein J2X02_001178 [Pseudoxanthomonas japonensis]|uniref:hypothetical protein n=1 Tax=Pseudoxanthomonas japonensis TaxID=69284 RepID=UPI00285F75E9|nr:hypothetical protein [Pseudoxanthomonas japonensis]MDR7068361.1 hypothetical protein [Pseudoxanthomonas japonensis]
MAPALPSHSRAMTSFPHLLGLSFLAALLLGAVFPVYASDDKYEECWKIHLDKVETGNVVEKGQAADISMFQNPFHFVPPTQLGTPETFLFCTLRPTKSKSTPRSEGVIFLGSHPLPLRHVGNSSIGHGTRAYFGAWKSEAEPRGFLEVSIHFETLAARVIILRGRVPNRMGMFGTGSAIPVPVEPARQDAAD